MFFSRSAFIRFMQTKKDHPGRNDLFICHMILNIFIKEEFQESP